MMAADPLTTTQREGDSPASSRSQHPDRIGRYVIKKVLGEGSFGVVYRAWDPEKNRFVAVKVPSRTTAQNLSLVRVAKAVQSIALLDHPHLIRIYDVGSDADYPCFIVSKLIDGIGLTAWRVQTSRSCREILNVTAAIADALHHAHVRGIVHRDLKPANILIDHDDQPHVGDFSLAPQDEESASRIVGTVAYMSPEQASGEGHRVDLRSDIFSLGTILYELLTGQHPFLGKTSTETRENIAQAQPIPPRSVNEEIPLEANRVCLRALMRRASDRYSTAAEFAEDLRKVVSQINELKNSHGSAKGQADSDASTARQLDVFISYSDHDLAQALEICRELEKRDVSCWIAKRDVSPGADYRVDIIQALKSASSFVLLLSPNSVKSPHVSAEFERAINYRKQVVPVCLKETVIPAQFELHLSQTQWIDASKQPLHELASELAQTIKGGPAKAPNEPAPDRLTHLLNVCVSLEGDDALIVPRGPRAFDESDSGFFLRLLPGPRDRDGLPDGLKFWKAKVESRDQHFACPVGIVYGPSGCGKTSRIRAALLPRLPDSIVTVFLESTSDDTEARLLNELHRKIPNLPQGLDLVAAMAAIRRGKCLSAQKKVTIFLDQFELWLHSHVGDENSLLVQAIRQCDGVNLQCIIAVRSDFWFAMNQFMQFLEIPIVEGENARLIDLLDLRHSKDVLIMFGQAMGNLPLDKAEITSEQQQFLDQAIQGLAQDARIVPVRLSLFAEMVKDLPWAPETLTAVGGIDGVGHAFLEEKFASRSAPPQYKQHLEAVRRVLRLLLPIDGVEIQKQWKTEKELLEASGYQKELNRFDELIRILDSELRLITPTDPEEQASSSGGSRVKSSRDLKCYRLTHDSLVQSLRDWLTHNQKETANGRAELLLEECSAAWNLRRESRFLPSFAQWLQILWFVPLAKRSNLQQRMIRRATFVHLTRVAVLLLMLGICWILFYLYRQRPALNASAIRTESARRLTSAPRLTEGQRGL